MYYAAKCIRFVSRAPIRQIDGFFRNFGKFEYWVLIPSIYNNKIIRFQMEFFQKNFLIYLK